MKIRKPRREEVDGCVALARKCFARERYGSDAYADLQTELRCSLNPSAYDRSHYFVAVAGDGRLAGLAGYKQSALDWGTYELFWIGVSGRYRGQGVGRMLVAHMETHMKRNAEADGPLTVLLACTDDLEPFYEAQQYHTILRKNRGQELLMAKLIPQRQKKSAKSR